MYNRDTSFTHHLDLLHVLQPIVGDSKLNPIEHAWAPVTMWCTGLVLDCKLPGEAVCPNRQSGLSDAEKKAKNISVFEQSMHKVQSVLQGRKYNEFVRCEDCDQCSAQVNGTGKNGGMFRPRPSARDEHYTTFDASVKHHS